MKISHAYPMLAASVLAIAFVFSSQCLSASEAAWAASPGEPEGLSMNAEPLRTVLSKIAPLEKWNASWSDRGPKICWKLFRPNPQQSAGLMEIISSFRGHGQWYVVGDCLQAVGVGARLVTALPGVSLPSTPAPPAPQISEPDAVSDLAALANEIEKRLDLASARPMTFSAALLTREGLQKSRGAFEDFEDGGQRIAYLITNPGSSEVFEANPTDIMLHFEPMPDEMTAIFGDIVGADLTQRDFQSLTESEVEKIAKEFPFCGRFPTMTGVHIGAHRRPGFSWRNARRWTRSSSHLTL